jgi:hypothetical protein
VEESQAYRLLPCLVLQSSSPRDFPYLRGVDDFCVLPCSPRSTLVCAVVGAFHRVLLCLKRGARGDAALLGISLGKPKAARLSLYFVAASPTALLVLLLRLLQEQDNGSEAKTRKE